MAGVGGKVASGTRSAHGSQRSGPGDLEGGRWVWRLRVGVLSLGPVCAAVGPAAPGSCRVLGAAPPSTAVQPGPLTAGQGCCPTVGARPRTPAPP